ncbi:hypothetical protein [Pseudomonas sp. NA-150]|uniref:hypothetical protein n=1 Tax=Pseudomonas sp. NA-150 TaxID=3367525 RepID=UPI0037C5975B
MTKWMLLGALLGLGGCASHHCDNSNDFNSNGKASLVDSPCYVDHLIYQNDMLQAKLLVSERGEQNTQLAKALLERSASRDQSGEAEFYQAVLLLRDGTELVEAVRLLRVAARYQHPLAIALLSQALSNIDPQQSAEYRADYAQLDVAKSGYPSFVQAQKVADGLIAPTH